MKRILSLTVLAGLASACGSARDAELADASAYLDGACPVELRGADVDVRETDRGVAMVLTTDDPEQVSSLRQLAARMAMEHTSRFDPLPDMEQRTHVTVHQLPDGQQQVTVQESATEMQDPVVEGHRSYASVVGVPGGVELVIEPRDPNELGTIRDVGYTFVDRLQDQCQLG